MTTPFRNTDKPLGNTLLAPSVVSMFDSVENAEAAVAALDRAGFGKELVYGRGDSAREGVAVRNRGWVAHLYRALQAVMSDEHAHIRQYEQKIDEGSSFVLVPLPDVAAAERVAGILNAHHVTLAHVLGRTGFRSL